jgi:hypothetical protein
MKRTFILLLALALALGLSLAMLTPAAASPGTTYYVSNSGNDANDGSWFHPFATIQHAVGVAASGDTIDVAPGTYVETGQITISKSLTITGADKATTIIKPAQDTGSSGDARGWFLVNAGCQFNLSGVTLDGSGHKIWQGIRDQGSGTIADCDFNNMQYEASGPSYAGCAMAVFGNDNVDITGCTFAAMGREGVLYFGTGVSGSTFSDNTYTGKGAGDWLDYGVEIGGGAIAAVTGNTITDCLGVASVDGSTSAGILVTDYFGPGTEAAITGNTLTDSTAGIAVGYDDSDLSVATVSGNTFENNRYQVDCTANVDIDMEATLAGNTFDRAVVVRGSGIKVPTIFGRIQDAIDAASAGDTIDVYPGTYDQDEANDRDLLNGGAGTTDLNIFVDKSVTIQGVDEDGNLITNADDVRAFVVPERDTPISNLSTIFVQADDVTITGLDVTAYDDPDYNFKTISVIGDNPAITDCKLHAQDQVSSIYMYDPRYDSDADTSYIQSYRFEENYLDAGGIYASGIRISSGPGWSGDVAGRVISGNTFDLGSYGIEFVGPGGDPWDVYPIGAATIETNSFTGQDKGSVVAWGKYKDAVGYGDLDWDGVFNDNTFDKSVIVKTAGDEVRYYDYTGGPPNFYFVRGIYSAIQRYPINAVAQAGDTIYVGPGTYQEQVVINNDLALQGIGNPVIKAPASPATFTFPEGGTKQWQPVVFAFGGTNTGGSISGAATITVEITGFTIDGNDRVPAQRSAGILLRNAGGTISDNTVENMSVDGQETFGISVYGDSDVAITENDISGYARGGIAANGDSVTSAPLYPTPHAIIEGNTVTGPGMDEAVTWAPNGIQIGWGATGRITGNNVSGNGWPGTAWSGSGIIVAGADDVEVDSNNVHENETGIAVCGYMWLPAGLTADGTWIHDNIVGENTWGISLQDKTLDTTIECNTVSNSSYDGIDICNFYGYAPTGTLIQFNVIADNNVEEDATSGGIWIDVGVDGNQVTVNFNNIIDNGYGIYNTSTTDIVDATGNWWGSASLTNVSGNVTDDVDYSPWWGANYIGVDHPWTWYTNDSIQEAIDDASAGDTILVLPGTYNELITINKALALQGSNYTNTIIDRSASTAGETAVAIRDIPSGNVLFAGFKILNGSGVSGGAFAITVTNSDASSVITISDNYIQGQNDAEGYGDWGLYAHGDQAKIVITNNTFNNTYNNEILFEKQVGETEVSYNTFEGAFPTIYCMTYGGVDVTTPQVVSDNTFEMQDTDPTWYGSAISFVGSYYNEDEGELGDGKFTDVTITGNTIQDLPYTAYGSGVYRGISLSNMDADGDGGLINGTSITNNTITGKSGNNAVGIKLFGKVIDTTIQGNVITGLDKGVLGVPDSSGNQYPQTTTLNFNDISANTFGVDWPTSSPILDATHNWWGDASGPFHPTLNPNGEGNAVSDNVLFEPWFGDEEMTILMSHSTYKFDYDMPDVIVATEETLMPVTFETDVLGQVGYDGVRFEFSATGPGTVTFKATDSTNTTYTFTNSGYWGPPGGFPLTAAYTATTDFTLTFSEPGTYTIDFSLILAPDGEVIAEIEGSQEVTVRAVDIFDFYKRLHAPYDKVATLDLLAAANDWSHYVTRPGFPGPITTLQLLQLANQWSSGG